jgi:hypothetical protein
MQEKHLYEYAVTGCAWVEREEFLNGFLFFCKSQVYQDDLYSKAKISFVFS